MDLAAAIGATALEPVTGGDVNDAYRATLADGTAAFVKTAADAEPARYAGEAAGLAWLAEAADGLAALHRAGADAFGAAPDGGPLRLGAVQLPNHPQPTWAGFYAECRLRPLATRLGLDAVLRVADRLPDLAGPHEPPARLHGDLWSGNVVYDAGGRPWLVDPAAHGGHREVDLAMLTLFGGPGDRCLAAYDEAFPLADGWRERVGLWQLLPLLVHAVLFGGGYAARADAVARRYL